MELKLSKQKTEKIILIFFIGLFLGTIALFSFLSRDGEIITVSAQDLRDEFEKAYTEEIEANGTIVEYDLTASKGEIEIFDGFKTNVWNYNGSVPGPEIRIKLGETIRINFKNELETETTVHFHGVRVPNAMDGVPGVTQEPIQAGESFIYEFTPKDAGTFWFHPHVRGAEQVERGLYGTLIVEDETSEQFSKDVVWVIDDWRLTQDYQVDPNFVTPHDLAHDGRWGNVITVNGSTNEKLAVNPGERIRLRLVNSSNGRVYRLNIPFDYTLIAVDGMYVAPGTEITELELAPGNRIDLDITFPDDADGLYSVTDNFTRQPNILAKFDVIGSKVSTPDIDIPFNEDIPEWKGAINAPVTKEMRLNAQTNRGTGMMGGIQWTINEKAFPDTDPIQLEYNKFNKLKFVNESYRLHPMHLHGQFFKVITRNGKPVNEPFFRDTVLISGLETVEVALVPLDKGEWANHCHILEHAEAGMMNIIKVD